MQKIVCLTVSGNLSVLGRIIATLARQRIVAERLVYEPSAVQGMSDIRLVTDVADEHRLEQLLKQCKGLIDVLEVSEQSADPGDCVKSDL